MAKDVRPGASSVASVQQSSGLPYRQFKERPTSIFIDHVTARLRETELPEDIPELFRNRIPKDAKFFIIKKIDIDGKKRPEGDQAPCPMCTPNRFLSGALVWLPEMQCCAVIGHCCADREARAAADREFRFRAKRDHEENVLLETLLLVPQRLAACRGSMPAAIEARRLFRKFRKESSLVQHQLRNVTRNYGGRLVLPEIIRGGEDDEEKENDYVGPQGFGRRGQIETREHVFGMLAGAIATVKDYNPVKELETVTRQLQSIENVPTPDGFLDFIVGMTDKQRSAAVAILELSERGAIKFANRLTTFRAFMSRPNADRLNKFGTNDHNTFQFDVEFDMIKGTPRLSIKHHGNWCRLHMNEALHGFKFEWPGKKAVNEVDVD
jgi:hypothetical protein